MNWVAVSGLAEVVGTVAVVISVLYLAFEIRSNTRTLRANSAKETQVQWAVVNETLYQFPHRMVIARAFEPDRSASSFSDEERQIVFWFARAMVQRFESELFQNQAGLLDDEIWEAHRTWCASFLRLPVFAQWWRSERLQPIYTHTFISSIDSVVEAVDVSASVSFPVTEPAAEPESRP